MTISYKNQKKKKAKTSSYLKRNFINKNSIKKNKNPSESNFSPFYYRKIIKKKALSMKNIIQYKTIFDIITQFQTFSQNHKINILENKITFQIFYQSIFNFFKMGEEKAKILFKIADKQNKGFLNFDEFLEVINSINISSRKDQLNLVFKLIDEDRNGFLDFQEIFHFSKNCFKEFFNLEDNLENFHFLEGLAKFFTEYVFRMCDYQFDSEIPIDFLNKIILNDKGKIDILMLFTGI